MFWDFNDSIFEYYQDRAVLEEELQPAICSKHRGMLTNGIVLQRDYAWPRTVAVTDEMTWKLKLKLLPHPAYGPDLAPSDSHIFRLLRDVLYGH